MRKNKKLLSKREAYYALAVALLQLVGGRVYDFVQRLIVRAITPLTATPPPDDLPELTVMNISRRDYFALQLALSNLSETVNTKPKDFTNWLKSVAVHFGATHLTVEYETIDNKERVLQDAVETATRLEALLDAADNGRNFAIGS